MQITGFLILFPLIPALMLLFLNNVSVQKGVVIFSSVIIAVASIFFAFHYMHVSGEYLQITSHWPNHLIMIGDIIIALVFLYVCRRLLLRQYWIPLLVIVQYGLVIFYDVTGRIPETTRYLFVDGLSAIMALAIGVVGTLITIYTVGYMRHYHKKHPEVLDRSRSFIAAIFLFFSAMFGIIFSNSITWIYFFWEVTTLCSFLMISYSGKPKAIENAFRALWMLLLGGLAFALAIVFLSDRYGTIELQTLLTMKSSFVFLPVLLICFAGMNKAALYPFSNWLLGAMVAPTPSSALLHSSTMVKAGVYIVLRCSPLLKDTASGSIIALLGGLSFLAGSALAISQTDGKRILAYSTIANLGLIVMCAGVGTNFTNWAAVLLIIFHAVAKALMFLSVGTVEHQIGSRNVEDMHGLVSRMPKTAFAMLIGLSGMFLAPFGMLISKWAVIEALAERNPIFPPIVIFGGSLMLFFWTKWMGKIVAVTKRQFGLEEGIGMEWVALWGLSFLTILACVCYPIIGKLWLVPIYGENLMLYDKVELSVIIMFALMLLPLMIFIARSSKNIVKVDPYLAGVNVEDYQEFTGSLGSPRAWSFKNYYIGKFFSEDKLMKGTIIASIALFVLMFFMEKL